MIRKLDKTKKANIKCEHCKHFEEGEIYEDGGYIMSHCNLTKEHRNYWNRCKQFEWSDKYGDDD